MTVDEAIENIEKVSGNKYSTVFTVDESKDLIDYLKDYRRLLAEKKPPGEWSKKEGYWECSECGRATYGLFKSKYCKHCGREMVNYE